MYSRKAYCNHKQLRSAVCIPKTFLNCENIHPLQQKKVSSFIDEIRDNQNVQSVIIFGSSVSGKCHMGSDVDVYLELIRDENIQLNNIDYVYDIWSNYTVDQRLFNEIKKTGVLVYVRDSI